MEALASSGPCQIPSLRRSLRDAILASQRESRNQSSEIFQSGEGAIVDTWESLLTPPPALADGPLLDQWLTAIAERLLNGCKLLANGHSHRLVEVEMYYHAP